MSYQITEELLNHCKAVLHQSVDSIPPSILDQAHRAIFGLPETMHMSFSAKAALEDAKKAAKRILELVALQGATGWPTDPQEVARRVVGGFAFRLEYSLHVYGNDRSEIRKERKQAGCSLMYTSSRVWVLDMASRVEWVPPVKIESEDFRATWLMADEQLANWTIESGVSCQERRERDDEAAKPVLEQEETPPERAQDPSLPEHPQEKHWV